LQGDNNSWVDSYQPSRTEVIGKLWIHLPQWGSIIQLLRRPINLALFATALAGILAFTFLTTGPKGSKYMTRKKIKDIVNNLLGKLHLPQKKKANTSSSDIQIVPSNGSKEPVKNQLPRYMGNILESSFFAFALIACASLILAIISFTRPASISVPDDVDYQHIGVFAYSAAAPSSVYDSSRLQTGEPIFPNLTCSVSLSFQYYLVGDSIENLAGRYNVSAHIIEPQTGWKRSIPLQPESSFSGNMFSSQSDLDVCRVTALIESMEAETGFHPSQYNLLISPQVSMTGQIQERELNDLYEPRLLFKFDRVNFSVVKTEPDANPFSQSEPNFIREIQNRANTIPLFGAEFSVPTLRVLALIGMVLSMAGMGAMWAYMQALARRDPETVIRMKYSTLIVDIQNGRFKPSSQAVEVLSMEDLANLAERHDAMILHETWGNMHNYFVQTDGFAYLYSNNETSLQTSPESSRQLNKELRRGLEQGEFQIHYQPIVSLTDGKITAVEALVRWQHPQKGLISARDFIPAAKHSGLIEELDQWVLQAACAQLKGWQDSGIDLKLAVNLSNHDLQKSPAKFIHQILQTTGIKPQSLQIEFPETDVLENSLTLLPQMRELKDLGINIAVDDFTGASAISSFSQFPISSVKFGRVAVKRLNDPEQAVSIQQMIMVARKLGLEVGAIGVETNEQKAVLDAQDCFQAQGFLLGHPVPAQEIVELFREREPLEYSKSTMSK
jgi:EAL domain-containing protein (putative c-di-GMP-specific phosphodiesterase class I)